MILKTIYHPPHLQTLGKLYIVFILRLSLFSFVMLSSRIINYHQFRHKTVGSIRCSLANYYLPLTPCKGLDLRYCAIFGRIIDEKILQSQFIYYVINFWATGVSFPMPFYGCVCHISNLLMVPISFWRNSDQYQKKIFSC